MAKLVVRPLDKGLRNDRLAFNIDNDSFPTLFNAYEWRGRIKRKRGTSFLGRLERYFDSTVSSYIPINPEAPPYKITLVSGAGNLFIGPYVNAAAASFTLQINPSLATANLVPGTITITDTTSSTTYTDDSNGNLIGGAGGTINYATGQFTITGGGTDTVEAKFFYYEGLPVMGLREFIFSGSQFPEELGFDPAYSYNIQTNSPYNIYDVSFYKNPPSTSFNSIAYTAKTAVTPTSWNGQDYQQFWTTNYQGALWATNGVNVPFTTANIGMQFAPAASITSVTWNSATSMTFVITNCPLVVGDWVFVNEFTSTTPANANTLNWQTGFVTVVSGTYASLTVTVRFPWATITSDTYTPGIIQYLTNRSDVTKDTLRWYDGDPTTGVHNPPILTGGFGWVNFMPPLSRGTFVIDDTPPAIYYLVGAKVIVPFKDRLLFLGPVVQTSIGVPIYLQDAVVYSQNGTPYYTASFTGDVSAATTVFHPLLVPANQTASAPAYFEDQTGFGGWIAAGISQPINSAISNEDVILIGFTGRQTRLVYTGDDILPFNFFSINSELGTSSTFSAITLDRGALTVGPNGLIITTQTSAARIDLDIPDQIFQFSLVNNGTQRVTSARDFINEWVYFTYLDDDAPWMYPNQTLQYNYRENTWAIFNESYTSYGQFRITQDDTWASIGNRFPTWESWNEPWNAGSTNLLQPKVIAGNQQGYIVFRDSGTAESRSLSITNIQGPATITGITNANPAVITANNSFMVGQWIQINNVQGMTAINGNYYLITAVSPTTITIALDTTTFGVYTSGGIAIPSVFCPNHCLSEESVPGAEFGDYIQINGALGTIASVINGNIYSIVVPDQDANNFFILPPLASGGTYVGGGTITRMYVPYVQTKQFPLAWDMARKTRLGAQQYLLSTTSNGQITLLIFLSTNDQSAYNIGPIVPSDESINNGLVYSTVLYTCPESTNLGLTPANINLQMVTAAQQSQIWHRMNTSLLGDTVQIGFTMSDTQMRDTSLANQFAEIELHGIIIDVQPSQLLA